jgi:hypothetical protein
MVRRYNRSRRAAVPKSDGSVIWTILLVGLIFCVVNFSYLFYATHSQSMQSSPIGQTGQEKSSSSTDQQQQQQQQQQQDHDLTSIKHADKDRILKILKDAHYTDSDFTPDIMAQLPTWQQVVDRLGPAPQIFGLDSCDAFQGSIEPAEAFIAPAGTFNSGTNLMAELLLANCYNPARREKYKTDGVRWQVNWGKHQPPKFRVDQSVYHDQKVEMPNENILPVVTIRDPYAWLQSMCRNRYVCVCYYLWK